VSTTVISNGTACVRETCWAPDTACVLGQEPCEHLVAKSTVEDAKVAGGPALPWSGQPLGLADLPAVAATGRQRLVAVVGAANAGKTTALAAHWLAARRGGARYGRAFAGSYTLHGWQRIARHLQWVPYGSGGFPPHTSASSDRSPALLHVAMNTGDGAVNILYTDVPGEWYRAWAYDAAAAPGAAWIAERADVFVVIADSAALAGAERGKARGDYEALAERVATVAQGRPVVPVRSKADIDVQTPVSDHIDDLNQRLFERTTTLVSAHERAKAPITEALDLGLDAALVPTMASPPVGTVDTDVLLAFRSPAAAEPLK